MRSVINKPIVKWDASRIILFFLYKKYFIYLNFNKKKLFYKILTFNKFKNPFNLIITIMVVLYISNKVLFNLNYYSFSNEFYLNDLFLSELF